MAGCLACSFSTSAEPSMHLEDLVQPFCSALVPNVNCCLHKCRCLLLSAIYSFIATDGEQLINLFVELEIDLRMQIFNVLDGLGQCACWRCDRLAMLTFIIFDQVVQL